VLNRRFTIVEGWNMRELRAALAKNEDLQHETGAMSDTELMGKLGHAGQHPEGRFLPETYLFVRGDSDLDILRRAHDAMAKALAAAWEGRAQDNVLATPDEALVLASIVEKETGVADERPQIAGVFARRLKLGNAPGNRPDDHLRHGQRVRRQHPQGGPAGDSPYNTYKIAACRRRRSRCPASTRCARSSTRGRRTRSTSWPSAMAAGAMSSAATTADHQAAWRAYYGALSRKESCA
jgi:UPF0755 protein